MPQVRSIKHFFQSLWQQSEVHSLLSLGGASNTPGINCPKRYKHSPTICHGQIQTALEQKEAPEHLQDIVWANTAGVLEKGRKTVQILLNDSFEIKQRSKDRLRRSCI